MMGDAAVASAVLALRGDGPLTPALRHRIADQLEALATEAARLRHRLGERTTVDWSPELDARMLMLLAEGLTYRVVGQRMSAETGQGISKDAVIGRAHRIEAPPRSSPIGVAGPRGSQRQPMPMTTTGGLRPTNSTPLGPGFSANADGNVTEGAHHHAGVP